MNHGLSYKSVKSNFSFFIDRGVNHTKHPVFKKCFTGEGSVITPPPPKFVLRFLLRNMEGKPAKVKDVYIPVASVELLCICLTLRSSGLHLYLFLGRALNAFDFRSSPGFSSLKRGRGE